MTTFGSVSFEMRSRKDGADIDLSAQWRQAPKALVLHAVDVPSELFTPIFAIGRTSGWTAHILEQLPKSTIIRPESNR